MKRTRNLFVLDGNFSNIKNIVGVLQFKGITILTPESCTKQTIWEVFKNNKSVLTYSCTVPNYFKDIAIYIVIEDNTVSNDANINHININSSDIIHDFQVIADKYNCDIGDHISNSSGLNGAPTVEDCVYCKNFSSRSPRIVYESSNFLVVPTVGEFITGYLLIIPKRHTMSLAEFTKSELLEFLQVLDDVCYILHLTYNTSDFLIFENGTGKSGKGKAKDSIVHAHVHVARSRLTVNKIKEISGFHFNNIKYDEIPQFTNHSYLLIRDSDDSWAISSNPNLYIPRQYIRQLLAEEHGIMGEQWNWRKYPFYELITKTMKEISTALDNNSVYLPRRIAERTKNYLL